MCTSKPPKKVQPPPPPPPPPPIEAAPEVKIGNTEESSRGRKRVGRSQLRSQGATATGGTSSSGVGV